MKVIVLDPGHGSGPRGTLGYDPGTVWQNRTEAEAAVEMALTMKHLLTMRGFKVVLTHDGDDGAKPDLNWRVFMASQLKAHALISIHYDSPDMEAQRQGRAPRHRRGVYYAPGWHSKKLAEELRDRVGEGYWALPSQHSRFRQLYIDAFPDERAAVLLEIDRLQLAPAPGMAGKEERIKVATPLVDVIENFVNRM